MGYCSETIIGDVWGWDCAVGDSLGDDGPPPEREGGYWIIWPVNILWKVWLVVVNCSLKWIIVLHNAFHGFREGWG